MKLKLLFAALIFSTAVGCKEIEQAANKAIASVQPPVEVTLTPFFIFKGYYVNVLNTSDSKTITGVKVTYTSASGTSVSQKIGTLSPKQHVTLDPSEINWQVVPHETITISATKHMDKTVATNSLIY